MFTPTTKRARVFSRIMAWGLVSTSLLGSTAYAATCEHIIENEWNSGFTASIQITNTDSTPINNWEVCWEYSSGHVITSSWNAVLSGANPYCASGLSWNSAIAPGSSVSFGIQASGASALVSPEITGDICSNITDGNTAPDAAFSSSTNELEASFDAGESSDPDNDTLSYSWDFGDDNSAQGETVTHVYSESGIYSVTLTVNDGQASDTSIQPVTVSSTVIQNRAPTASFTTETNELSVGLDGSGSTDPDGDVLTYLWDFGDGSNGEGVQASHAYATDGSYTISLTVSDGSESDVTTSQVSVSESVNNTPDGCSVDYSISNVGDTSFQVSLTVTNDSNRSYSGYDISWNLGAAESFGSGWNAEFSSSGLSVTASNEAGHWNGELAANGGSVNFGFIINKSANNDPFEVTSFSGVCSNDGGADGGADGGSDGGNESNYACGIDPTTIPTDDDWLTTSGNQIVDSEGNSVWLAGANWFGMNATERVFHGLWSVNMENLVRETAERGINLIRVPISTELMKEWIAGDFQTLNVNLSTNPNLTGLNSLEVFDYFLAQSKSCGLKVLMDVHSAEADNSGHIQPMWYKGDITTQDWIDTLAWMADRYKDDDTIIGYDLQNEPHGSPSGSAESPQGANESDADYCNRLDETTDTDFAKWDDSTDINNWKYAAEQAATAVLNANPNALILVEGIEAYATHGKWVNPRKVPNNPEPCYSFNWWGGNLKGVADMEVEVPGHQNQIMYSPHDYGPLVFLQSWFQTDFDRDSLRTDVWEPNWLYIHNEGISPLLIGEWGGFLDGGDNQKWMEALRDEIAELRLHHTFWVINPNSGDTGGLLKSDWVTWDEEKYDILKPALWQENGQFVGLDKEVPIGGTANTGTVRP